VAIPGLWRLDSRSRFKTHLPKWETEWGIGTSTAFTDWNQAEFIARRLLEETGLGVEHSLIYEFANNGPELYGVDSMNPLTPKTAFYAVQRIIAALAGARDGTSFVTVNSVAEVIWLTSRHQHIRVRTRPWWLGGSAITTHALRHYPVTAN